MKNVIIFRCDDEILEILQNLSYERKINKSAFIRTAIMKYYKKSPKDANQENRLLETLSQNLSRVPSNLNQIAHSLNMEKRPGNQKIISTINNLYPLVKQTISILKARR